MNYAPPEPAPQASTTDIMPSLRQLWKRKWAIVMAGLAGAALAAAYVVLLATPTFVSTATLKLSSDDAASDALGAMAPLFDTSLEAINTEVILLTSGRFGGKIVDRLGLVSDPEFNAQLRRPGLKARLRALLLGTADLPPPTEEATRGAVVSAMLEQVAVRNLPNSHVLEISVESSSSATAARIANAMAEEYIAYQRERERAAATELADWLGQRAADLKARYEEAERRVNSFTSEFDIVSEEQLLALQLQAKQRRDQLALARRNQAVQEAKLEELALLGEAPNAEAVVQYGDLQLSRLFAEGGASPAFEARRTALEAEALRLRDDLETQIALLGEAVLVLENRAGRLGDDLGRLQQLTIDAASTRALYEDVLSNLKEVSAGQHFTASSSEILTDAGTTPWPQSPRLSISMVAGFLMGLALAATLVLMRFARRHRFFDAIDLEEFTQLPLLGQIPHLGGRDRRGRAGLAPGRKTSPAGEAIRNLRTSLLLLDRPRSPKVVALTSARPAEGKSTVAILLAQSLADLGRRTLLIDADLRRQSIGERLGMTSTTGLVQVLRGMTHLSDAVTPVPQKGFDVLSVETRDREAVDLLFSARFDEMLDEARVTYDAVIIDTPPVLAVPDARSVAKAADAVVLVVRSERSSQEEVHMALRLFENIGARVDGLVLNDVASSVLGGYGKYIGPGGEGAAGYYA